MSTSSAVLPRVRIIYSFQAQLVLTMLCSAEQEKERPHVFRVVFFIRYFCRLLFFYIICIRGFHGSYIRPTYVSLKHTFVTGSRLTPSRRAAHGTNARAFCTVPPWRRNVNHGKRWLYPCLSFDKLYLSNPKLLGRTIPPTTSLYYVGLYLAPDRQACAPPNSIAPTVFISHPRICLGNCTQGYSSLPLPISQPTTFSIDHFGCNTISSAT
jgi:hypothetical protein